MANRTAQSCYVQNQGKSLTPSTSNQSKPVLLSKFFHLLIVTVSTIILFDKLQRIEKEKKLDYSRMQPAICLDVHRKITEDTVFETQNS
jgi:hypothetical protein